jgi:CHASE1-domain containing sensor protein
VNPRRERHNAGLPRRFGRGLTAGVVAAIILVGIGTSAVLYVQAEGIADREQTALTNRAARAVQSINAAVVASLGGASATVDEDTGRVDEVRFNSFASGVVNTTLLPVLADVQVVPRDQRTAVEAELGVPLTDSVDGKLVPSPDRDQYLVVRLVYPRSATTTRLVGFDIASEPIRAAAATASAARGSVAFSAPVTSASGGQIGFFAITPLYRPGVALGSPSKQRGDPVGYVSSLVPAGTLLNAVRAQLPSGARVSITDADAGAILSATATAPSHGQRVTITQTNRRWTVAVEYRDVDRSSALLSLVAALLLAIAVGVSLWRNVCQTSELRSAALGVRRLGELSEQLAVADTRDEVVAVVLAAAADPVRAAAVAVSMPQSDGRTLVTVRTGQPEPVEEPMSVPSPISDAWNTRTAVFLADEGAFRGLYGSGWEQRAQPGVVSSAALPLRRPDGEMVGVLSWDWMEPQRFSEGERSAMQATAELVQQSVVRSRQHEQRWEAASALLVLSQRLSVARTIRQVAEAVIQAGPAAASADHVGVGFINEMNSAFELFHPVASGDGSSTHGSTTLPVDVNGALMSVLRRGQPIEFHDRSQIARFPMLTALIRFEIERLICMPLIDSNGQLRGVLAFVFVAGPTRRPAPDTGRLATIADVTAQTVERAMLYLQEHELVVNLQRQTLADLPHVDGLDVAARYLPSSATLGLGGDWYDVYLLDGGRVGAVVGDVSGHGIDAIADMTEFRTTISTLLRTDHDLGAVPARSTALLRHEQLEDLRFATAGLMIVDVPRGQLSYIRAGHPPMLVRHGGGEVVLLERGGGGPIGVTDEDIEVQTVDVGPGSVVVAYTDGLVERREESIDLGLQRLCHALESCTETTADGIADALIEECLGGRQTADDTALLVMVFRPRGSTEEGHDDASAH